MVRVFEDECMGECLPETQSKTKGRKRLTQHSQGVANVTASMVNSTEGVIDVFDQADDDFEFDEELRTYYTSDLLDLILGCMAPNPDDRPTFPVVCRPSATHTNVVCETSRQMMTPGTTICCSTMLRLWYVSEHLWHIILSVY
jgi:hypothetical protein